MHGEGEAQILPNLRVITGGAQYRAPKLQRLIPIGTPDPVSTLLR